MFQKVAKILKNNLIINQKREVRHYDFYVYSLINKNLVRHYDFFKKPRLGVYWYTKTYTGILLKIKRKNSTLIGHFSEKRHYPESGICVHTHISESHIVFPKKNTQKHRKNTYTSIRKRILVYFFQLYVLLTSKVCILRTQKKVPCAPYAPYAPYAT